MSAHDTFPRLVTTWLDEEAVGVPPDYLGDVLARTSATRQRPVWLSPGRWLPMTPTVRVPSAPISPVARLLLLAAALFLLALGAALVAGSRQPRIPPPFGPAANGRLFFDSRGTIVSVNVDGSDRRVLVQPGPTVASTATVSPDGTLVAYVTTDPSQVAGDEVWVLGADGSGPVRVSGDLDLVLDPLGAPSWSPDSRQLVFHVQSAGKATLLVAAADGSWVHELAEQRAGLGGVRRLWSFPTWSPSGAWIAFVDEQEGIDTALAVVHPDGSDYHRLTTGLSATVGLFGAQLWAPDLTNRLLYGIGLGADCQCSAIGLVDVDDGTEQILVDEPGVSDYGPAWSPRGDRIAFHRAMNVVVRSPDGSVPETVLPDQLFNTPLAWSPDGEWLYGLGLDGLTMGRIDPDGREPVSTIEAADNASRLFGWQRLGR
jgi:Tol biopolymer transport system component